MSLQPALLAHHTVLPSDTHINCAFIAHIFFHAAILGLLDSEDEGMP
jgi:hypothetical protein